MFGIIRVRIRYPSFLASARFIAYFAVAWRPILMSVAIFDDGALAPYVAATVASGGAAACDPTDAWAATTATAATTTAATGISLSVRCIDCSFQAWRYGHPKLGARTRMRIGRTTHVGVGRALSSGVAGADDKAAVRSDREVIAREVLA